jgi:biopolymer transport protein ExbD
MERSALSAAQRGKVRRLSAPPADEEASELNVVPFLDIITNVLMFVLATVAITFTATVDTRPPSTRPARDERPLNLSILVSDDGLSVKTRDGTIAKLARDDYAGLQRCVAGLKASADFADETSVTLSASAGVRYESLIATMDAVRTTDDGKELFPDVAFGVVR